MEDLFLVEFASTEKQFVYNVGVNRGHSLSYSKVNRCLFISSEAKQLYHNICDYAYGDKRDCFPSHQSLLFELGWGQTKLKEVIKELKESNLIKVKNIPGKSSIYSIQELHKVPALYHSEIIYAVINLLKSRNSYDHKDFIKKFNEYKKSDLFKEVVESGDPTKYSDILMNHFCSIKEESEQMDEPSIKEESKQSSEPSIKEEKEVAKKQRRRGVNIVPTELNELDRTGEHEPVTRKSKKSTEPIKRGLNSFDEDSSNADLSLPKEQWGFLHLFKFFNKKYEEKYGNLPMSTVVDGRNLKRIINRKSPMRVITDIENYFALETFTTHSMQGFCGQWVQSTLDTYLNSGKLPSYKTNTGVQTPSIEKDKELSDWSEGLDDIFKR